MALCIISIMMWFSWTAIYFSEGASLAVVQNAVDLISGTVTIASGLNFTPLSHLAAMLSTIHEQPSSTGTIAAISSLVANPKTTDSSPLVS